MSKEKIAIIESGSKQYIINEGDIISVEKLDLEPKSKVKLKNVLLIKDGNKLDIGTPFLDVAVEAELLSLEKDKKIRVFKFKKKTGYKKTQGHRQKYSTIKILKIGSSSSKTKKADVDSKTPKTSEAKSSKKSEKLVSKKSSSTEEK